MNTISQFDTKHGRTLEALRRSICMAPPGEEMVLRETALTAEYGMSRTPIRQILQRLAYERLVETRSGVGTIVVPFLDVNRQRDLRVFRGIIQAILLLDLPQLTIAQHSDILALAGIAELVDATDREMQYDVFLRLHHVLSNLIPDPILLDTFSSCFWRVVRWHMSDLLVDPEEASTRLRTLVKRISGYEPRNSTDLFQRVIEDDVSGGVA